MVWIERHSSSLVSLSTTRSYWASLIRLRIFSMSAAARSVSSMTAPMLPGRGVIAVWVGMGTFLRRLRRLHLLLLFLRTDDFPPEHLDHAVDHVRRGRALRGCCLAPAG